MPTSLAYRPTVAMSASPVAIVFVVDGLNPAMLGPYGNAWIETPACNRLAASGELREWAISDCPTVEGACRAWWQGRHALDCSSDGWSLPAELTARGMTSWLLTDDQQVATGELASGFEVCESIEQSSPNQPAASVEETQLARLTATAVETIERITKPGLLWIHSRGMYAPWDAPSEFRERLAHEDDPDPPTSVATPEEVLPADHDPDVRLALTTAYAAQVSVVDACLEVLLQAINGSALADAMVVLTSARGFPLGEHLRVGSADPMLHEELLHVPLMIREGGNTGVAVRQQAIIQPPAVTPMLANWLGLPLPGRSVEAPIGSADPPLAQEPIPAESDPAAAPPTNKPSSSDGAIESPANANSAYAISLLHEQVALRTSSWFWRGQRTAKPPTPTGSTPEADLASEAPQVSDQETREQQEPHQVATAHATNDLGDSDQRIAPKGALYAKPDDRWEVSEVANRCEQVDQAAAQVVAHCEQQRALPALQPPHDELLLHPWQ